MPPPKMYTIYGLLAHDERFFSVKIDKTQSVVDLKKEIKKKNAVTLANVDAKDFKLYHVDLEYDKTKYLKQAKGIFKDPSKYKLLELGRCL
jgi:hypothetical protein